MRLLINNSELTADLVDALNATDCLAAQIGQSTLQVLVPWLVDGDDTAQAAAELLFFVKAWASRHPDFLVTVLEH